MSLFELFIISIGLSMDAVAVAVGKGLSMKNVTIKESGVVGVYFGVFQGGMPLLGYFLGVQFQSRITSLDHWIAFILLGAIGLNMIRESRKKEELHSYENYNPKDPLNFITMMVLALATSIDALAVGVTFAFLKVNIAPAITFIGIVTFTLSMIGVKLGNAFGVVYKSKAEFIGGTILIFMGIKILLEHTGII